MSALAIFAVLPMAEAIFRHLVNQAGLTEHFEIASVGTDDEDAGLPIHPGTQHVLRVHTIPIPTQKRSTLVSPADIERYDYILAMTQGHLRALHAISATPGGTIVCLMKYAPKSRSLDVPDPYYTGQFDLVYDMIHAGCCGLLNHIQEQHQL